MSSGRRGYGQSGINFCIDETKSPFVSGGIGGGAEPVEFVGEESG
jgi:hypothetical protein